MAFQGGDLRFLRSSAQLAVGEQMSPAGVATVSGTLDCQSEACVLKLRSLEGGLPPLEPGCLITPPRPGEGWGAQCKGLRVILQATFTTLSPFSLASQCYFCKPSVVVDVKNTLVPWSRGGNCAEWHPIRAS